MIKFGTSGWRAIIADEFTYDAVELVSQAIADYLNSQNLKSKEIVVGYDTRFMSEDFAVVSSEVLAGNGFTVYYSDTAVPTPTISYEIIRRGASGGINITASHNPHRYNGIKFSPSWGGPALPETTKKIEENCAKLTKNDIKKISFDEAVKSGKIIITSFKNNYLKRIAELVDMKAIKKSKISVAVDLMHGAGIGYLDEILKKHGIKYTALNTNRDCLFGGHHPEPSKDRLKQIISMVKSKKYKIGIATDGDADRFGIIDTDGTYITPNELIAVLLYHLVVTRKWKGVAARSVMTSSFIDAVAKSLGVEVKETPVGFKYIGDILIKEEFIIGGEESGGLSIRKHVPEKDGVLAVLLAVELVAVWKKSIRSIIKDLEKKVGKFITDRVNYKLTEEAMQNLKSRLQNNPPKNIAGRIVKKFINIDGYKFVFDNDEWLGIRLSGTEPVVRCYIEAHSQKSLKELLKAGENLINN
jgi:phosphoglucomutase